MKKWLIVLMIVLCVCGYAAADGCDPVELGQLHHSDLDGDGMLENWQWTDVEEDNGWETIHRLTVTGDDGKDTTATYDINTWMWYSPACYLSDMNDDGIQEIFVTANTGENGSFTTWCLNYSKGVIEEVMFADTDLYSDAYFTYFPGYIKEINDDQVALAAYTDVLGTWVGSWRFTMGEKNRLEPVDDGWCVREFSALEGPYGAPESMDEYWEYCSLTLELETAYRSGDQIGILSPGDRILITGTDHDSLVSFVAEDGREGQLYIRSKMENVFGWQVNMNTEEELQESNGYTLNLIDENAFFDRVPYGG